MTTLTLQKVSPSEEILPRLREAFQRRVTVTVGDHIMVDYSPYEGLRYCDDQKGEFFIAAADAEVESIPQSAQRAYQALFEAPTTEIRSTGTKAIRTSAAAAHAVSLMLYGDDNLSQDVYSMKITISRTVGGYVHVPLAHKKEVLDMVSVALDVAGETLEITQDWEDSYEEAQKEVKDLLALYEKIENL